MTQRYIFTTHRKLTDRLADHALAIALGLILAALMLHWFGVLFI